MNLDYDNAEVVRALEIFQMDLTRRKGHFWTRKVVFFSGLRSGLRTATPRLKGSVVENLVTLISQDMVADLREHFPSRRASEMSRELAEDSSELIEKLIKASGI